MLLTTYFDKVFNYFNLKFFNIIKSLQSIALVQVPFIRNLNPTINNFLLINTLLKHLRWNNECKSKYNMETLTSEQKEREKLKRKARDSK